MKATRFAAVFAAGMIVTGVNAGWVTYGNLPQTNDDGISADLTGLRRKAMGFTTDNQAYDLLSMDARFMLSSSTSYPTVELFSSVAGGPGGQMPGTFVGEFAIQLTINPGIHTIFCFPFSIPSLAPNATYWIVVGGGFETYDWRGSDPPITPTGFASHAGSLFSTDGGANWATDSVLNSFNLYAEPIPEPATFAALGLLTFGLILRRKR